MAKLFVAVELATATTAELLRLQPPPMPGIRLVEQDQMHLTLHFLGEASTQAVSAKLQQLIQAPFTLEFDGVGQFPSAGGDVTLWAGVRKSEALLRLHRSIGEVLATIGFKIEARPYSPHVTLARLGPGVPENAVTDFLARHAVSTLAPSPASRFGLFSSESSSGVPSYRCEQWFPLMNSSQDWTVHRQDDNGNRFVVQSGLNKEDADKMAAEFEARGHKQLYWVERSEKDP